MVWIDVDIGSEAVDGRKMEDPSPFLMGGEAFQGAMGRPHSPLFYAIIKAMPRGQLLQAKKERMKPDEENCCDCYWC